MGVRIRGWTGGSSQRSCSGGQRGSPVGVPRRREHARRWKEPLVRGVQWAPCYDHSQEAFARVCFKCRLWVQNLKEESQMNLGHCGSQLKRNFQQMLANSCEAKSYPPSTPPQTKFLPFAFKWWRHYGKFKSQVYCICDIIAQWEGISPKTRSTALVHINTSTGGANAARVCINGGLSWISPQPSRGWLEPDIEIGGRSAWKLLKIKTPSPLRNCTCAPEIAPNSSVKCNENIGRAIWKTWNNNHKNPPGLMTSEWPGCVYLWTEGLLLAGATHSLTGAHPEPCLNGKAILDPGLPHLPIFHSGKNAVVLPEQKCNHQTQTECVPVSKWWGGQGQAEVKTFG